MNQACSQTPKTDFVVMKELFKEDWPVFVCDALNVAYFMCLSRTVITTAVGIYSTLMCLALISAFFMYLCDPQSIQRAHIIPV